MLVLWNIKSWAAAHHLCDYPTAAGNPVTVPPVSLQASAALGHFWVGKLRGREKSGAMLVTAANVQLVLDASEKRIKTPKQ